MKKILYTSFVLGLIFLFASCSGSNTEKETGLIVQNTKISSWINKMPMSTPSFHVTGDIELVNTTETAMDEIRITSINVFQKGEEVFRFGSEFLTKDGKNSLGSGESGLFTFTSPKKLDYAKIDAGEPIHVVLIILVDGEPNVYTFNNIPVEIAY